MGGASTRPARLTATPEQAELLAIARSLAAAGADAISARLGDHGSVKFKTSGTDPVSEADEAGEAAIRSLLAELRPEDGIVGEEGDDRKGTSGLTWFIDPIDGTVNFLYGLPQWCVSVAVADVDGPLVGVVLDPCRSEEFAAVRGCGATLNSSPIERTRIRERADDPLEGVLFATGFGYDPKARAVQGALFSKVIARVRDARRAGSAALDLCWTAAGRLDAYLEHGTRSWDVAAAGLICLEAGLEVVSFRGANGLKPGLVAGDSDVCAELIAAYGETATAAPWPGAWVD